MGITSNKEINELARKAVRLGWSVFVSGRHLRWVPPDDIVQKYGKAYVTTSISPSDMYAINNIERDLRKAGLWHLEETLENAKYDQTKEEKYLELGTSLPIARALNGNPNPTLADVAPPELVEKLKPQQEELGMAKKTRVSRTALKSEILEVLSRATAPMDSRQIYGRLPAVLVKDLDAVGVMKVIANIKRSMPGAIDSPAKGFYVAGNGKMDTSAHKPVPQPDDPLANAQEILDRAMAALGDIEKLVARVKEQHAAMAAVRKLLGA